MPGIAVRSLTKEFRRPVQPASTVRELALRPFRRREAQLVRALDGVSFDALRGECLGVIGPNGSGKTTLLRCLSGIHRIDGGEVHVRGRVAPFVELGVGFNPELTARDNVVVNGVLLGLTPREARRRFDRIAEFAELTDVADSRLKTWSSGMIVRLAFAVTVEVDAEVLLFDEVLAVGDERFRTRCFERFDQLRASGRTIVLVTHDLEAVESHCDRALLLGKGELRAAGDPHEVVAVHRDGLPATAPPPPPDGPLEGAVAVRGPTAFGEDPRRLWTIARTLAASRFEAKYGNDALGIWWAMARPLALFAILLIVFTGVGNLDEGVDHYPQTLLLSVVLWTFVAESTATALTSLVREGSLLRKLPLPGAVLPLAVVLTSLMDLAVTFVAVVIVLLATGVTPDLGWLELPFLVAALALLVAGIALALSALYVAFRDVDQIWALARQALFFGSPVLYVAAKYPESVREAALASPLAAILTEARHAVVDPSAPSAAEAIGGAPWLLVPAAITLAIVAVGAWLFTRGMATAAERV